MTKFGIKAFELMLGAYEEAIKGDSIESIERWSDAIEKTATAVGYENHKLLMRVHTCAEQRVEELMAEREENHDS